MDTTDGIEERENVMTGCTKSAEWQINDYPETPDGYTHACSDHVGHLVQAEGGTVSPLDNPDGWPCCYIHTAQQPGD